MQRFKEMCRYTFNLEPDDPTLNSGGHGGFLTLMKFDKMKPGGSAELLHAATGLGVYFIISMVLDTGRDDDGGGGGGGLETKESARHDSKHFFTARDYSKKLSGAFQDGVGGLFWLFKKVIIPTLSLLFSPVCPQLTPPPPPRRSSSRLLLPLPPLSCLPSTDSFSSL